MSTEKLSAKIDAFQGSYDDPEGKEIGELFHQLPTLEEIMAHWGFLQKNTKCLFAVHPWVERLVIWAAVGGVLPRPTWEESQAHQSNVASLRGE